MEPNLEPRRRNQEPQRPEFKKQTRDQLKPLPKTTREIPIARPSVVTVNEEPGQYYVQTICLLMGATLLAIGLIGFVMDNFLMAHFSYSHSLIHVVAGVLAIGFGYYSIQTARVYSYAAGTLFGLLGVIGFIASQRAMSTTGHIGEDQFLWVIQKDVLEFGTADHILHLLYAVLFFVGARYALRRRGPKPTTSSR